MTAVTSLIISHNSLSPSLQALRASKAGKLEGFSDANICNFALVAQIMKMALAKIAKEAKECMQECVSEFIPFITSEGRLRCKLEDKLFGIADCLIIASEKCHQEKRKTVNGEDIENYANALKIFLSKYREVLEDQYMNDRKMWDLDVGGETHRYIPRLNYWWQESFNDGGVRFWREEFGRWIQCRRLDDVDDSWFCDDGLNFIEVRNGGDMLPSRGIARIWIAWDRSACLLLWNAGCISKRLYWSRVGVITASLFLLFYIYYLKW